VEEENQGGLANVGLPGKGLLKRTWFV